jgi:hypothetical protein
MDPMVTKTVTSGIFGWIPLSTEDAQMDAQRLAGVLSVIVGEHPAYDAALVALINAYTSARSNPATDSTAEIEKAREALSAVLNASQTNRFAPSQLEFMKQIGAIDLFGLRAVERIDQVLRSSINGLTSVITHLEGFRSAISAVVSSATQLLAGLQGLHVVGGAVAEQTDFEVGVLIPSELVDDKLGPLAKQLDDWNKILKTFAELAGEQDREVTVKALSTGSYILYVKAGVKAAKLVAGVIGWAVSLYKKLLDLRDLREKFAHSDVPAPEVGAIKQHEAATIERAVTELVSGMMRDAAGAANDPGRRGELEVSLTLSVRKTIRFIDDGGAVEVTAPLAAKKLGDGANVEVREAIAAIDAHGAAVATLPPRGQPILEIPELAESPAPEPPPPASAG